MTFQKRMNYPTDKITPSKTVLFCGPRLSVKKSYDQGNSKNGTK